VFILARAEERDTLSGTVIPGSSSRAWFFLGAPLRSNACFMPSRKELGTTGAWSQVVSSTPAPRDEAFQACSNAVQPVSEIKCQAGARRVREDQ
jgi:hypothetical protein